MEKATTHIMASDNLAANQYLRPEFAALIDKGDGAMTRLANAHEQLRQVHTSLRAAYSQRDPERTEEGHFMEVRKLGLKSVERASKAVTEAEEMAMAEVSATRAAMRSQLGLVEDHRAGEIRSLLRTMKPQERDSVLQEAVKQGDAKTIAAITDAPAYLSGVKAERQAGLRRQFELEHGGEHPARIAALEKAIGINSQTAEDALTFIEKLLPSQRAREIEAKQAAAREMRERLEG